MEQPYKFQTKFTETPRKKKKKKKEKSSYQTPDKNRKESSEIFSDLKE